MKAGYEGWSVKLEVHNYRGTIKSSNVIGYITGGVEPDRLIYYDYSIGTNILLGILLYFSMNILSSNSSLWDL